MNQTRKERHASNRCCCPFLIFQQTHVPRREAIAQWEEERTERMTNTCLQEFPILAEEKFLLDELSRMYHKDERELKTKCTETLRKMVQNAKHNKHEVTI